MWLHGVPVVVTGIERRLQGKWTPDDFIYSYGSQKVTPIDSVTCKPVKGIASVEAFFSLLKERSPRAGLLKLKVYFILPTLHS